MRKSNLLIAVASSVLAVAGLAACGGSSGASGNGSTITVSYSEEVADELPLWMADELGYFKAQGLTVKLTSLSSDQGFPALISGQTQFASIGGSQIVSGAAAGAEVKYIATLTPVFPYELWTKADSAADLKGKKIGITSASGSIYIATLAALHALGMSPDDVQLVPLGSVTNVNNALVAGTIDAAVSHPPASATFEKAGFHSLLNLAAKKLPNANVGIAVTKAYLDAHHDTAIKFLTAIKQAMAKEKSDEAASTKILGEHLGVTDQQQLDETWMFYANEVLPDVPTPTVDQLKSAQDALGGSVAGVDKVDLSSIVDASLVQQVFGS